MSCCLHNKGSDLLETESDTWAVESVQEVSVKSERQQSRSPVTPESESERRQLHIAERRQPSFQRPITSASIVANLLRKHKPKIYACSFCDKAFSRKGVWKRHEESLHEPQREWCCFESGCNRKFTARNKFRRHHECDHGCENCKHDSEVISKTQATSAWGCGFCIARLESWDDRANHIAIHFENGSKKSDWDVSRVIQSLQCANPVQSATSIAQSAYTLGLNTKFGDELDTSPAFSSPEEFYPSTAQEFLANPLEPSDPVRTHSNTLIDDSGTFQPTQPLITPALVAVDDWEGRETFPDNHVFEECFECPKDYVHPCPETLVPTSWIVWPYP